MKKCHYLGKCHRIFLVVIFIAFSIWYTIINPTFLQGNMDDWRYISFIRIPIPKWGYWNPIKVFPETINGVLGDFSAFVVTPIIGDYITSFTYVYGIFVAFCVTVYICAYNIMIKQIFNTTRWQTLFSSIFFVAGHFLLFKSNLSGNLYMLTATSINCLVNYLVPFLSCSSFAFLCMAFDIPEWFSKCNDSIKKGGVLLILYLSIFSNLINNIVLVSLIFVMGCRKLFRFVRDCKKGANRKIHFREWSFYFITCIMEVVCMIFELNGGRANNLEFNIKVQVKETIVDIIWLLKQLNRNYVLMAQFIAVVAAIVFLFRRKVVDIHDKEFICFGNCIICFFLCSTFQLLMMIRVGLHKITRPENVEIFFIYGMLILSFLVTYLIKSIKWTEVLIPIGLFLLVFWVISYSVEWNGGGKTYWNYGNMSKTISENRDIVNQFVEADRKGLSEFEIEGHEDISPEIISTTLFRHHIISRRIDAIVKNEE